MTSLPGQGHIVQLSSRGTGFCCPCMCLLKIPKYPKPGSPDCNRQLMFSMGQVSLLFLSIAYAGILLFYQTLAYKNRKILCKDGFPGSSFPVYREDLDPERLKSSSEEGRIRKCWCPNSKVSYDLQESLALQTEPTHLSCWVTSDFWSCSIPSLALLLILVK